MKEILYFTAGWCQPCQTFKPIMESLSFELPIRVIDVDSNRTLASQYNVRSIPTTLFLSNGTVVDTVVGVRQASEIRSIFDGIQ